MEEHLTVGEFSKKIECHSNTIDNWFKQLEDMKIHCVNRSSSTGKKVYDELDLRIALHIKDLRQKRIPLEEIFDDIGNHCQLRYPVHNDSLEEDDPLSDAERLKIELVYTVHDVLTDTLWDDFEALRGKLEKLVNSFPDLKEGRYERINDALIIRKVEAELQLEALQKWSTKPVSMRTKRVFLLKRKEDIEARNQFVKEYINQHLEPRIRKILVAGEVGGG
ncbi:MerR family transcriptional regulator [Anaerobacillus sp. MEB173]|uniref:MerR family transcriptional regulator n=1 Tax=Anaerobacillus sp. MEB173 TaxID=3383345 RepID=UPI003F93CB60